MMDNITEEQFAAYEKVRSSGVTNMFNIRNVTVLSGLSKDVIFDIIANYNELSTKYPDVVK